MRMGMAGAGVHFLTTSCGSREGHIFTADDADKDTMTQILSLKILVNDLDDLAWYLRHLGSHLRHQR
jgi:hypothetical protein